MGNAEYMGKNMKKKDLKKRLYKIFDEEVINQFNYQ